MPILEAVGAIALVGVVALLIDYVGDGRARSFARGVFFVVALRAFGITWTGLASFLGDAWMLLNTIW